jgi:predicted ATP-dependent protease
MPIHRPEAAKAYIFKSFANRMDTPQHDEESEVPGPSSEQDRQLTFQKTNVSTPTKSTTKKKTVKAMELEKEENVARLLGAIRLLCESWADHLSTGDLDRRAWTWYVAIRPEVESGPSGWGAKGRLKLSDILALRRKEA